MSSRDLSMFLLSNLTLVPASGQHYVNRRTAGGLSHLRTAGGRIPAPQRTRKLRKIATSGKRRSIGRDKFYQKYFDNFFDQVKFEVTGGQKRSTLLKIGLFSQKVPTISIAILASRIVR